MSITALPTPPQRSDGPDTFANNGDTFIAALPVFVTEANALASQVSIDAAAVAAAAPGAIAAANFKGEYAAGTTYQVGQSVSYGGDTWFAKTVNLGVAPAIGANWQKVDAIPPQAGQSGKLLGTNGADMIWTSAFPPGTAMLFAQTSAPTGWTKSTTHNNKALRVVSGTAGSGGTSAFTSVFARRTPAGSVSGSVTVGSTTLAESQMPAHTHTVSRAVGNQNFASGSDGEAGVQAEATASTGGGGSHTHTGSMSPEFAGAEMDFAVAYVDVIIATKD